MRIYYEFDTKQEAIEYRRERGTGGWIFAPAEGPAFIFPPDMTPTPIMTHPLTKGSGELIGCEVN